MSGLVNEVGSGLSRRALLRYGLAGAVTVGAGGLLSACGRGGSSDSASAPVGPPRTGGTLTVGMPTGGAAETLDPWRVSSTNDYLRMINLYDTLFEFDDELNVQPALAESGEPSADNLTWTIRLRNGVTFHDGSSLTADDVLFNVQAWMNPTNSFYTHVGFQIDPQNIKKVDDRTVSLGLQQANARFNRDLAFLFGSIKSRNWQEGGDPIGTGPFKFASFQPGTRSEFVRFDGHWRSTPTYLDRLVVDSSFSDENARTNAFRAGQVDMIPFMSLAQAGTISGSTGKLLRSPSAAFATFTMAVDTAPFDDVRVRQALRLLVDRQAMVDVTFNGYGSVTNDVPGKYTQFYDDSLVRERDVDQAKFLLRQAGKEGLTVTLETTQFGDILTQQATLYKQQAAEAGVTVNIEQVDIASYFDPAAKYGKMPFAQTLYYPVPSMPFVWTPTFLAPAGGINETHWYNSPGLEKTASLVAQARATSDDAKATEIWRELQKQQFDEGGYILPGVFDYVDGVSNRVQGLTPSKYLFASGANLRKAWLSS